MNAYQYIGSLNGRNASRISNFELTTTEESVNILAFATSFWRGVNFLQVEEEVGNQNQANIAKVMVPAPKRNGEYKCGGNTSE